MQLELLKKYKVDFIVLARYMQIISSKLIDEYNQKIINIHHSFYLLFQEQNHIIRHIIEELK